MTNEFILPGASGIRINLNVTMYWQPLYYACKPVMEIDGAPVPARWGIQDISLHAGTHSVHVYFPYLGIKQCGRATMQIVVSDGSWTEVTYKAPIFVFQPGKLKIKRK